MHGDFGDARGRRDAFETRNRNDELARRERIEAEAVRSRLEKQGSVGARVNRLGPLAAMTAIDGLSSRSLEDTLGALRRAAQGPMRKAVERMSDAGGGMRTDDGPTRADHFADGELVTIEEMRRRVTKAAARRYW